MTRKEILEILNNKIKIREEYNPRKDICDHWIEGIDHAADAILALPIDVPGDEEIENKANGIANPESKKDFERWQWLGVKEGARWMRDEIIKRNRP